MPKVSFAFLKLLVRHLWLSLFGFSHFVQPVVLSFYLPEFKGGEFMHREITLCIQGYRRILCHFWVLVTMKVSLMVTAVNEAYSDYASAVAVSDVFIGG
jgi:hypothetical protein